MDDCDPDDLGPRGEDEPARIERRAEQLAADDVDVDPERQAERELIGREARERLLQEALRTEDDDG